MIKMMIAMVLLFSTLLHAQESKFTALFLLNFAKYIEWPAEALNGEYVITVIGETAVVDELKGLASKTKIGERSVTIKTVASAAQIEKSHIIYISPEMSSTLPSVVAKYGETNTLIVSNKKGLAKEGSAINLFAVEGQIKYEINTAMMKKNGLMPKPVLFKLGTVIDS